jgi:hypothetical protein
VALSASALFAKSSHTLSMLRFVKLRFQCLRKSKDNLNYPLYIKLKGIAVAMPFLVNMLQIIL